MAPRLILTTRPAGDADEDVAFLKERGHGAVGAPMLEIKPLEPALPDASEINTVVFTSRHAAALITDPSFHGKDCYCVGERTARAAERAGFVRVTAGPGDGEGLARLVAGNGPGRVLWASGADIGFDMEGALAAMGVEAVRQAVYKAARVDDLPSEALGKVREGLVGVVMAHSGRAGGHFSHLLERHGLTARRAAMTLVAVSPRAAGLCGDGWHTISVADPPTRRAMLDQAVRAIGQDGGGSDRQAEGTGHG